jgi:hypothetical protein
MTTAKPAQAKTRVDSRRGRGAGMEGGRVEDWKIGRSAGMPRASFTSCLSGGRPIPPAPHATRNSYILGGWAPLRSGQSFGPCKEKTGTARSRPSHKKRTSEKMPRGFAAYGPKPKPNRCRSAENGPLGDAALQSGPDRSSLPSDYSTIGPRGERRGSLKGAAARDCISRSLMTIEVLIGNPGHAATQRLSDNPGCEGPQPSKPERPSKS